MATVKHVKVATMNASGMLDVMLIKPQTFAAIYELKNENSCKYARVGMKQIEDRKYHVNVDILEQIDLAKFPLHLIAVVHRPKTGEVIDFMQKTFSNSGLVKVINLNNNSNSSSVASHSSTNGDSDSEGSVVLQPKRKNYRNIQPSQIKTRSQSGVNIKKPNYYSDNDSN